MNSSGKITVVIVNYNGGTMVTECLASLRLQTFADFSSVVIDNRSTDGSVERIAAEFPEVNLFALETNTGFASANNYALGNAQIGDWVVFLNPDAFPKPDWLACLVKAAEQNPNFSSFGSRLCSDAAGLILDGVGDKYHVSGLVWREGHGSRVTDVHLNSREIFAPCAAAAMFRKDTLLSVGGFDGDLFCYVEDVDLGFRLRLAGHRSLYVPDAIVHHLGSGVVGAHSDFQIYHGHRNLVWVYIKNMPGYLFWLFLPTHIVLSIATLVWFTLRGHGAVIFRAKRDALYGIPRFWNKRKTIQATRKISALGILPHLSWNPFKR